MKYTQQQIESRVGKKFTFTKTFKKGIDSFGAVRRAEAFCEKAGLSIGSMCSDAPIGLAKGKGRYISKWYNLGEDVVGLDGVLVSKDFRDGDVTVLLSFTPKGAK